MERKRSGVAAILLASVMWALEPVFAKLSFQSADFLQTSTVRAFVVTTTALLYTFFSDRGSLRISRTQLPSLIYIALAGTLLADLVYILALTRIPVINAVIIGHMQPIFIVLFGFAVLRSERLTVFDGAGIVLMIAAGLLVTTKNPENFRGLRVGSMGDLLVLAATIAWATTAIAMKRFLGDAHAGAITFYRYLFASVGFLAYLALGDPSRLAHLFTSVYQVLTGIVVGIGTILYYVGLKRIKAAQVGALELSTPFFATVLGFAVLGETVTTMQVAGMALLFGGIYLLSRKEEAADNAGT